LVARIVKNKLFFFGGEQMTTPAFHAERPQRVRAYAADACRRTSRPSLRPNARAETSRWAAPFGTKRGSRAIRSIPNFSFHRALALSQRLSAAENACGLTELGAVNNLNEYVTTVKVDYQKTVKALDIRALYGVPARISLWDLRRPQHFVEFRTGS